MKKRIIGLVSVVLLCLGTFLVKAETGYDVINVAVTNIAASSTNTTAGQIYKFWQPVDAIRLYVSVLGTAATTNATAGSGAFTVKLSTASGNDFTTNNFDTADWSNIKVSITNNITSPTVTRTVHDWFDTRGVKYIRVGQVENQLLGVVSNVSVTIGYEK
jgi:hypothetical protein